MLLLLLLHKFKTDIQKSNICKITIFLSWFIIWQSNIAQAQFAGGDGSEGNPYQITNLTELNEVRNYRAYGNYFVLMNDIDARDTRNWNNGQGWEPISPTTYPNWFTASLDGNGYVIYGLYINRPSSDYVGLFGFIYGESNFLSVKNLGLVDVDITGDEYVGALAGNLNSKVEYIFSTGEINGRNHTGGLFGTIIGSGNVSVNYSFSHAETSSSNYGASGLVARQQGGAILNSFSTGVATAPNGGAGGLIGEQNSGTVTNSFWDTETSGLGTSAGQATGKTTSEMHTESTFSGAGWDFSSKWEITDVYNFGYPMHQITKKYGGGSGTSGDPYLIKNTFHLRNVYDRNTNYYQLSNDIDLDIYPFNSGKGWDPIGTNSSGQEFHGRFDGSGYKIKNLFIDRPSEDYIGLFGSARYGYVRNVGLEDVDVTGKSYVGSIVGVNYTQISQTYSTGSITASDHAGGLTGLVETWTSAGEITNSYSSATITATVASAGGLTGRFISGSINNSYAVGLVSSPSNAGGIVGEYNSGTVTNNVFWNTVTTGQAGNPGGGVGKTLNQLKTKSTFIDAGWDFSSVWDIVTGDSTSYPYLKNNEQNPPPGKQFKIINYAGGQGTVADPYLISSPQQLDSIRYHLNDHYKLTSNINMNVAPFNTGEGWEPIGTNSSAEEFSGSLDGDGYKIQNLLINRPSINFIGLFGAAKNAVLKNIGVENANVNGKEYVGTLAGINYSEVRNSYSTGSVKGVNHTGGLIGGIETWDGSTALVVNSYSTASAYSSNSVAGGLVGRQISGTIEHSYSAGEAFVLSGSGGLIGEKNAGTVTNSYWNNEFQCQNSSADGTELSVTQLKQQSSFSDWDFTTVWNIDENNSFPYLINNEQNPHPDTGQRSNIKLFDGGCGTQANPYEIATATQLDSVRLLKDKYFIQTADIDLDVAPFNSGAGWEPIGAESNSYFSGSYNGNGYSILNLYISRSSTSYIGLFRRTYTHATLKNMRIDSANVEGANQTGILVGIANSSKFSNVRVSGSVEGNYDVGGLIGLTFGSEIDSAYSDAFITVNNNRGGGLIGRSETGKITKSSSSGTVIGNNEIGGLIGRGAVNEIDSVYSDVSITSINIQGGLIGFDIRSEITHSYSSGSVTGRSQTGGVVGYGDRTIISQSYSESDVSITSGNYNGGFIGYGNRTTITNSYAIGSIISNSAQVAGFAGRLYYGSISNSYFSGKLTGSSSLYGFIAINTGVSASNIFWNTESSTQSSSNGGTGLTTREMKQQSPFSGWDFSTIWGIDELSSYPYLKTNEPDSLPGYGKLKEIFGGGFGIESNPYKIASAVHLDSVRYFMGAHFVQVADIDLDAAPFNSDNGWDPIGTNTDNGKFTGSFNGNGFTINNLFINRPSENFNGLFGSTFNAVLKNMILINIDVTGQNYNGGLVGLNYSDVLNSYTTGTVSGVYHTGGLAGASESSSGSVGLVSNSYSTASASSSTYGASALVGRLISGSIENSYGVGSVSAPSGNGGLIGEKISGTVTNSYWDTETTGQSTSADGTGLTTVQMKQRNSFSGFDFANTWFIEEGSGYPKFQEQKYNELVIDGTEGWRMLSSPVSGTSYGTLLDPLWTQGFTGADVSHGASNVYTWSESSNSFQSISDADDIPSAGTGFLTFVYSDDDKDGSLEGFPKKLINSASEFNGQASPSISFTDSGVMANDGWNLVGNPYGTSINWGAQNGWNKKNIDATFYVWSNSANNGNGSYLSWNGIAGTLENGKIAPWQGFWIKAHGSSPEFSVNDSTKNRGGSLMKTSEASTIKFTASGDSVTSKAIVLFYKDAFLEKDQFDAYKLQPLSNEYLSLFTGFPLGVEEDESQLDINALPDQINRIVEVPINMELSNKDTSSTNTEINLSWDLAAISESWEITLLDLEEDQQFNLKEVSSITFSLQSTEKSIQPVANNLTLVKQGRPKVLKAKSDNENRFILRITGEKPVSNERENSIPVSAELLQNYPNPFNPSTTIGYGVPENGVVTLEVFDMLGRKVATLLNGEHKVAGRYSVDFNASNLASGMYVYRLRTSNSAITKKLTLIK